MSAEALRVEQAQARAQKQRTARKPTRQLASQKAPGLLNLPERRSYAPTVQSPTLADLPFTQEGQAGEPLRLWAPDLPFPPNRQAGKPQWRRSPAEVRNYGKACLLGMEYAAHWMQYIKDSGGGPHVYSLSHIVRDMDFSDESAAKGCIVGFFTHLERAMRSIVQHVDVYQGLDEAAARLRPQVAPAKRGGKNGRVT